MKFFAQLSLAAALLALIITAAVHPEYGVLPANPWSIIGLGLIGLGLIRNVQQALQPQD